MKTVQRIVRWSLFAIFFCIDITVHATELALLKEPVQEPQNCLNKSQVCAFGTFPGTKYVMVTGSTKIVLGEDSFLVRSDRDRVDIVKGLIWVTSEDRFTIGSEYGEIEIYKGEALIMRMDKRVVAKSLNGNVTITPKGGLTLAIEKGFENSMSPVGSRGTAGTGIPQLIDLRLLLREVGLLHGGDRHEFEIIAQKWFRDRPATVEKASQLHESLMKRSIASAEDKAKQEARRQSAMKADQLRMKQMFRTKSTEY